LQNHPCFLPPTAAPSPHDSTGSSRSQRSNRRLDAGCTTRRLQAPTVAGSREPAPSPRAPNLASSPAKSSPPRVAGGLLRLGSPRLPGSRRRDEEDARVTPPRSASTPPPDPGRRRRPPWLRRGGRGHHGPARTSQAIALRKVNQRKIEKSEMS
jgi:hypothetical protein